MVMRDRGVGVGPGPLQAGTARRVWIHGDLFPSNLHLRARSIGSIIDFGLLGLGDPATDMLPAWTLLTARSREFFRAAAEVDNATWSGAVAGRLSAGLGAVRVYRRTNPVLAAAGRHASTRRWPIT
jgi:aminoglycoside phosphotransferase (APT) family kinase protein